MGHLRIRDAFHSTKHSVEENDGHPYDHAYLDLHLQKPRKDDAHTSHLSSDIGERDKNDTNHCYQTSGLRIVTIANKIGDGELPKPA